MLASKTRLRHGATSEHGSRSYDPTEGANSTEVICDSARTLNIAATCSSTEALGPGRRAVAWVQGCPFECLGCVAPEWIPDRPAQLLTAQTLADRLLADPAVDGFTFSGGEPMEQADGLADTIAFARRERDLSLICFTGYRLERLRDRPPNDSVPRLLSEVDVLIDGLYVRRRDDDRGLRGSSNQRVHHLTDRLTGSGFDFEGRARDIEIRLLSDSIQLVGLPNRATASALDSIMSRPLVTPRKRSAR
jgi:anaerobic ribonucleoside-triphosphate reductase activating protein